MPDALGPHEFPSARIFAEQTGFRTLAVVPVAREDASIGVLIVRDRAVNALNERQLALLSTFADQAVIAIENVRLFTELNERNAQLREALEHQTATGEVLGIIASSPTEVQPVLEAICASAARVCGATFALIGLVHGEDFVREARIGMGGLDATTPIRPGRMLGRVILDGETIAIEDQLTREALPSDREWGERGNFRSMVMTPLVREGTPIGAISVARAELHPFTPTEVALLQTFAKQAVIAIENARLFNDLRESLEQQTATAEVLNIIASSPTDIRPVLAAIVEAASRLCGSDDVAIRLLEGDHLILKATTVARAGEAGILSALSIRDGSADGSSAMVAFPRAPAGLRCRRPGPRRVSNHQGRGGARKLSNGCQRAPRPRGCEHRDPHGAPPGRRRPE